MSRGSLRVRRVQTPRGDGGYEMLTQRGAAPQPVLPGSDLWQVGCCSFCRRCAGIGCAVLKLS